MLLLFSIHWVSPQRNKISYPMSFWFIEYNIFYTTYYAMGSNLNFFLKQISCTGKMTTSFFIFILFFWAQNISTSIYIEQWI